MTKTRALKKRTLEVIPEQETTSETISQWVDRACEIQEELKDRQEAFKRSVKHLEDAWDECKNTITEYAKTHKTHEIKGEFATAKLTDVANPPDITPRALWDFLKKEKKSDLFFSLVKVSVTEARTYLGKVTLDAIGKTAFQKFARLKITRR